MTETITKPLPSAAAVYARQAASLAPGEGLGHQIKPFAAMGALFLAAGAVRVAMHATGVDEEIAWTAATAAFVIAVVTAHASKRRFLPKSKVLRQRFLAALYLGAGWVAAVAHYGMSMTAFSLLAIVGTCLSLAFLREHSISAPPAELMPILDGHDLYVERWEKNLGAKGKALAGSRLLPDPTLIRAGYKYTLQLVAGSQTVTGVIAQQELLRSGLRLLPGQEVIVEQHPDHDAATALLTVVVKSPIKESRPWPGALASFDAAAGAVNMGPFVDDEGVARWAVYRQNGIFGGFMQGDPGSGKSRLFEALALSVASSTSHPTTVWFACGQRGASSPMLVEHADWAATTIEDFHDMLTAACNLYVWQSKQNKHAKLNGFTPLDDRPGLLIFVDELHGLVDPNEHAILGPANAALMLRIAREARKAGVAIIAADQSPTLDAFGGSGNGMQTLRSALLNGNGVLLRSENNNAKQVFKVDIDPRAFPKLPGYAWLARPADGERSAPYRGYHVTDTTPEEAAEKGIAVGQIYTEPTKIRWRSLTEKQANLTGSEAYKRRHEIAQEREEQLALELELAEAGMLDTLEQLGKQMDAAASARGEAAKSDIQFDFADGIPSVRPVARFWMTAEADPQAAPMTPGETKVLSVLAKGAAKPGEIVQATGLSPAGVHAILGKLVERGLAGQRQKYGPYQLAQRQAA
jgi:hypothetical protein